MFGFKKLSFIILLQIILAGFGVVQAQISSADNLKSKEVFVCIEGAYSIALSNDIRSRSPISQVKDVSLGGFEYGWRTNIGAFLVGVEELILSSETFKKSLENAGNKYIEKITNIYGKLINRKEFPFDGGSGLDIRMQMPNGEIRLHRIILVGNRLYTITSAWRGNENGEAQIKIFDSFKAIDSKAIIAKKVEEATPKPLPQTPVVKKVKTDAEDVGLKGKVKSVALSKEDLTLTWSIGGVQTYSEDFYNESGYLIKLISYYKGSPNSIWVFGYLDGMRVSDGKIIDYGGDLFGMVVIGNAAKKERKTPDTRYSSKYEYKYDDKKRLTEKSVYGNDGELTYKIVYLYDGNKVEETTTNGEGKINWKIIEVFDEKSNMIEKTFVISGGSSSGTIYKYTYQSFDEKGNWTKRTVSGKEPKYGGGFREQNYVEYRNIMYHP